MHHPKVIRDRNPEVPGDGAPLDTVRDSEGRCRLCGEPVSEIRITDSAISALIVACGVCGWHAMRRVDQRDGDQDATRVRWTS